MARKQNGGLNKFLNLIGLVDDDRGQDHRAENYNAENYGRPSTYIPPRQRGGDSSRSQRSLPSQSSRRNDSSSRRSYDGEERYARRSTRFDEDYDRNYDRDYEERGYGRDAEPSRPRSRFEEDDAPAQGPSVSQNRAPARGGAARTVMFSLKNLRDANPVITALVKGSTIVMTIETNDEYVAQRIVDTLSGAVFALNATIRKASDNTYLLAPQSVNVKSAYEVDDQF